MIYRVCLKMGFTPNGQIDREDDDEPWEFWGILFADKPVRSLGLQPGAQLLGAWAR